jgi:hypothetical protein
LISTLPNECKPHNKLRSKSLLLQRQPQQQRRLQTGSSVGVMLVPLGHRFAVEPTSLPSMMWCNGRRRNEPWQQQQAVRLPV